MAYTSKAKRNLLATSADEPILELVEITHPDLAVPARFVNDNANIVVEGNTYFATSFRITRPDDVDQQLPQARLAVDNIGRELTQWLEVSNGGKGAKCRLLAVMRSTNQAYALDYFAESYTVVLDPVIEFDMTLDLTGLTINSFEVAGMLGFQNTLMQPAVTVRYDPFTSPGLF